MADNDRADLDWEDVRYFIALAHGGTMRTDFANQKFLPDLTSQDYLRNPAPSLARLRTAGPMVEVRFPILGKTWITTTHELADRILKDSETFTMRKSTSVAGTRWLTTV